MTARCLFRFNDWVVFIESGGRKEQAETADVASKGRGPCHKKGMEPKEVLGEGEETKIRRKKKDNFEFGTVM